MAVYKTATCKHFCSLSWNYVELLKHFPLLLCALGGISALKQTGIFHSCEMGGRKKRGEKRGGKKKKARILDHLTKLLKSHSLLITSQRCPWVVSLPRTQRDLCLMYFTTLSLGKWNVSGGEKLLRLQPYPLGFRSAWDQQLGVFSLKLWRQRPTTNARGLTSWFHTLGQSP